MQNKLSLKKQMLAELTSDELRTVIGGVASGSCTSCACSCHDHSCNTSQVAADIDLTILAAACG